MSALNPPDAPPAAPVIPEGLATRLGKLGALALAIATAVTPFLDGDQTGNTRLFAILTTAVLIATILGRMLQAAAAFLSGAAVPDLDALIAATEHVPAPDDPADVPPDTGDGLAAARDTPLP